MGLTGSSELAVSGVEVEVGPTECVDVEGSPKHSLAEVSEHVGVLDDSAKAKCDGAFDSKAIADKTEDSSKSSRPIISRDALSDCHVCVFYATQTGGCEAFAKRTQSELHSFLGASLKIGVFDLSTIDAEDFDLVQIGLFIVSTYESGKPSEGSAPFFSLLDDLVKDWRISKSYLKHKMDFSVFGCGNSLYEDHYNAVAIGLNAQLKALGSQTLFPLRLGDSNAARKGTFDADIESDFESWLSGVTAVLADRFTEDGTDALDDMLLSASSVPTSSMGCGADSGDALTAIEDIGDGLQKTEKTKKFKKKKKKAVESTEDCCEQSADSGSVKRHGSDCSKVDATKKATSESLDDRSGDESLESGSSEEKCREMLTERMRASLRKQGYKLIGSHSGVKLCRWTKSFLRGRGGCYKHTCYGIMSYGCMEMTPSLACANKCVFCWRHHSNPVAKSWQWEADSAQSIVDGCVSEHLSMIAAMRGVPGVTKQRLAEARSVRHCALSLVGEPIMYPHINEVLRLLHAKEISTFLVTNAQFPELIRSLDLVTQLYVSVDASDALSLKKIDRPLFKDYWPRFLHSMDALREKKQRTVYRLTLVKGATAERGVEGNMASGSVANYARLIKRGMPSFVEVKGVTFCGKSEASNMRMESVPFHFEVRHFCEKLVAYLGSDYALACEHSHSCLVLIAKKQFLIEGRWHTWIDFAKFSELQSSGEHFTALDYAKETPQWAVYGAEEEGFNPEHTRFRKRKRPKSEALQSKIDAAKRWVDADRAEFFSSDHTIVADSTLFDE